MDLYTIIKWINPIIILYLDLCIIFVAINPTIMIGRSEQTQIMRNALQLKKSSFIAITGRRRVGKTFIVREIYEKQLCFSVTGIQNASLSVQIGNFIHKLLECLHLTFTLVHSWRTEVV